MTSPPAPLAARLRAELSPRTAALVDAVESLEALLERHVASARETWPGLTLDVPTFLQHLARHLPDENAPEVLRQLHASDLYLACACATGEEAALLGFEHHVLRRIPDRLHALPRDLVDEALQRLREQLLLGRDGVPAKISTYSGRGPLLAWVTISAARLASQLAGREGQHLAADKSAESYVQLLAPGDPELELLRKDSRAVVVEVLRKVLAALPGPERALLRLHHLHGYSMTQLATVFGESRSGVARRVLLARERLLKLTRTELASRLQLDDTQLESFLGLIRSRLDLSLSGLMV
ncbi:RNA polymerase subunit sigma-70 [Myxococcus stipitatus]|uniref:sigma factor-like helix-turn-helix DNA-binding protein n=1 Tax=Myxococcus stipitatus TaxID=83455 RepID=UPI001F32D41F|nr:sigma factor-like helix-turn-helix DNA-binding protein [Myxococcus stipitatus]MCE9673405.1 RNA polymerase subunit sigma-70 [Myxococcus stipitatus]